MVENKQDILVRAFAALSSLRTNIDQMADYKGKVTETYVREFHAVLDRLGSIEMDVSDFRIPDLVVKPVITASTSLQQLPL